MTSVQPIKSAKSAGAGTSLFVFCICPATERRPTAALPVRLRCTQQCRHGPPADFVRACCNRRPSAETLPATRAMAPTTDEGAPFVEQEPIIHWDQAKKYHWDSLRPEQTTDQGQLPKHLRAEAVEMAYVDHTPSCCPHITN